MPAVAVDGALRRLLIVSLLVLPLGLSQPAAADDPTAVDVVVVSGPMDTRTVDFVMSAITDSSAGLVVLQMDVLAVLTDDVSRLVDLVADPPVPVAVWVGPAPAVVRGAAVDILAAAAIRGAAPGVTIGPAEPRLAGRAADTPTTGLPSVVVVGSVVVDVPIDGLIDIVEPSIGQFVVGVDGLGVPWGGGVVTLHTAVVTDRDGIPVVEPAGTVRFVGEGIVDRILHVTVTPEAAYFFLLLGLALAAFEFYAAGPGVAAAVAAIALLLAGYGLSVLPVWLPSLVAALGGIGLYLVEFQRNDLGWKSIVGTVLLFFGGVRLVDGGPHFGASWWVVGLVVAGVATFFALALTTMVRARFSTQTIGRDHLIGRRGMAVGTITPEGEVEVDGARWRARSTRQSGIAAGDEVVVVRIAGVVLEVDPI